MHELEVSIHNPSGTEESVFESAAAKFVEDLQKVSGLETSVDVKKMPGTRGVVTLLTGIVVTGIHSGAFSAIYMLAKDLFSLHSNAEVELKFKDGSTIKLKNLTQSEAQSEIDKHLAATTPRKKKR
jgi:hypothetical protein